MKKKKTTEEIQKKMRTRAIRRARMLKRKARKEAQNDIPKEIREINIELIHFPNKEWHIPYVKYWRQDNGRVLRYINCPWTLFVEDYIKLKDEIWKNLDNHICTMWERDIFLTANRKVDRIEREKIASGVHPKSMAKRLIKLTDSIRKYGYCDGVFADKSNLINVIDGYVSPYDGSKGYKLLYGNHRISVCAGLGIKKIKVVCWEHYRYSKGK